MFAQRMSTVHRSFIREILKVTADPSIISFAGGLPNPELFPVAALAEAAAVVFREDGKTALQYSTTEGYPPLREWISKRYLEKKGLTISQDALIITTGSQQCLDILGKVFLDKGDVVVMERPGYLGSIQAFSIFEPRFAAVPMEDDGPDIAALDQVLAQSGVKFFYGVPNFQNPSGLTYSLAKRKAVAEAVKRHKTFYIEDDPYGELRFKGEHQPPLKTFLGDAGILLGSFSKIAAPGFRLGWVVAEGELKNKLVIAKQASDLHTSTLTQRIMHRYLIANDIDSHIALIQERYGRQRDAMVAAIHKHFPKGVKTTEPEGGMFLWATLPEGTSAMALFEKAIKQKVAFVPGKPFYTDGTGDNTLRLNFSNSDEVKIEEGIKRLGVCLKEFLAER